MNRKNVYRRITHGNVLPANSHIPGGFTEILYLILICYYFLFLFFVKLYVAVELTFRSYSFISFMTFFVLEMIILFNCLIPGIMPFIFGYYADCFVEFEALALFNVTLSSFFQYKISSNNFFFSWIISNSYLVRIISLFVFKFIKIMSVILHVCFRSHMRIFSCV